MLNLTGTWESGPKDVAKGYIESGVDGKPASALVYPDTWGAGAAAARAESNVEAQKVLVSMLAVDSDGVELNNTRLWGSGALICHLPRIRMSNYRSK